MSAASSGRFRVWASDRWINREAWASTCFIFVPFNHERRAGEQGGEAAIPTLLYNIM